MNIAQRIPILEIKPDPEQPRKHFDDDALARLADTIREHGQLVPAHVRRNPEGQGYIIVDGERRYRALQKLTESDPKFSELWAVVGDELTVPQRRIVQVLSNEMRLGHTPLEKITIIAELREAGIASDEIPKTLGMTPGEFRLLNKLGRAEPWLLDFGRPEVKLAVPVVDENGSAKRGTDEKPKTYTRSFPPLPLTHLDQLVTAANTLRKLDDQQAATSGRLQNYAQKIVTRLAHKALIEEWSVRHLSAHAQREIGKIRRKLEPPRPTQTEEGRAVQLKLEPIKKLPRESQIASLREAIETLGLTVDDLRP
ncbi:MAG: ParB/RepB/Spo0J family partition protein [Myxococcota bacterium]